MKHVILNHLDLWTGAVTKKSGSGRGSNGKVELTGVKRLRELILELAVRGSLVDQDPSDEPAQELLERCLKAKAASVELGKLKKARKHATITSDDTPFGLSQGWVWSRLDDLVRVINGRAYKKHEMLSSGTPLLRVGNLFTSNDWYYSDLELEEDKYIDSGDLIYAWSASFGPFIWDGGRAIYHYHIWKLDLFDETAIDKRFLYLYLKAVTEEIKSSGSGIAMIHMTKAKMEELIVPIPPLEEQHRIVQKVDELMALCDRLEQQTSDQIEAHETLVDTLLGSLLKPAEGSLTQSENATELADNWARLAAHFDTLFTTEQSIDKLRQTILQLAVMGRLVEQDAEDEPATELLKRIQDGKDQLSQSSKQKKAKPLPPISESEEPFSLPSGWTLSRLDDITDIQGGIAKGKKVSGKKTHTLPYLRVANVQRSSLNLSEIKEIEIAEDEVERYLVRRRDLLITEGGDWDKVGRTAIWDGSTEPMAHQNHVFRARLILAEQNEHWLERYLNSQFARDYFAGSSKQTTNLASINKTQLRSCTVPLPPLAEQHRIVQKVDELMALCDQLKERLKQASETRRQLADTVVEGTLD
jgi:type I restriction enzyme S subunit